MVETVRQKSCAWLMLCTRSEGNLYYHLIAHPVMRDS